MLYWRSYGTGRHEEDGRGLSVICYIGEVMGREDTRKMEEERQWGLEGEKKGGGGGVTEKKDKRSKIKGHGKICTDIIISLSNALSGTDIGDHDSPPVPIFRHPQ